MLNLYELMNATADHIAQHPGLYNFQNTQVPPTRDTDGCILGRMGQIAGFSAGTGADFVAREIFGYGEGLFFKEVARHSHGEITENNSDFSLKPQAVAKAVKTMAETARVRYEGIPVVVRDIFNAAVPAHVTYAQSYFIVNGSAEIAPSKPFIKYTGPTQKYYDINTDTFSDVVSKQHPKAKAKAVSLAVV